MDGLKKGEICGGTAAAAAAYYRCELMYVTGRKQVKYDRYYYCTTGRMREKRGRSEPTSEKGERARNW